MSTETIDIRVREDGSRAVTVRMDQMAKSADKASGSIDMLKRALGALTTVLAVNKLRDYADTWSDLNSRVKLATGSQENATAVMGRLSDMARRTYSSLEATAESFLANSTALKEMGLSTAQSLDYVEALNNALVVSGAKAERAASVQDALSKAMMLGSLSGQNLNTVISTGGRVAELLAAELGVTTSELLRLGQNGKITGEVIRNALIGNLELLREEADAMPATIGDAFVLLENGLLSAIGKFDQMGGVSETLAELLVDLADNMEMVVAALLSIGAAVAVAFAPGVILKFTAAMKTLFMLMMANPFVAVAAALASLVAFMTLYGDEVNAGIDATTTIKDVMRAFLAEAVDLWNSLTSVVTDFFNQFVTQARDANSTVTSNTQQSASSWLDSYGVFFDGVGSGFSGILRAAARVTDAILGLFYGLSLTMARTFGGIPQLFVEVFNRAYNAAVTGIENIANATIAGMNKLRALVGKDPIEMISLERQAVDDKAFENYGKRIGQSFDDGFGAIVEHGVEARLNRVFERAQQISQTRLEGMGDSSNLDESGPGAGQFVDPKELAKQQRELEKLQNQFKSLMNTIDPIRGAQLELADAQTTLNKALAAGIITTEEHGRYLKQLQTHYADILDPLGKLNRELDEQTQLLKLNSREREVESQLLSYTKQLQKEGVQLTAEETDALRAKLQAVQQLNEVTQAQDSLLANSVGQREQYVQQLQAIQALLADTGSGFTQGDATNALAAANPDLFSNTDEMFQAQTEQFERMYEQVNAMREADLISEQTASAMKVRIWQQQQEQQLATTSEFFGHMSQLQRSENSKIAAIGKAAAVAQAVINTYQAATAAYASLAAIPVVGPALGAAAAGAAVVAGMANVAQIRSQPVGFMTGGSFTVGGTGGADSQMVSFRATPGEQVSVSTPTQVRKGNPQQQQLQEAPREVTINQTNNFNQPSDNRTESQRAAARERKQRQVESRFGRVNV